MNATIRILSRVFLLIIFLIICLSVRNGISQEGYPNKYITVIEPSPVGMTDTICRILFKAAEKELGQPIILEGRPGGGGVIAVNYVLKSKPDAYTLGITAPGAFLYAPQMKKTPYHPLTDSTDITTIFKYDFGLAVRADAPWNRYEDVIEYARKNPGKFTYTAPFVGGTQHVFMERIAMKEGIKWTFVPYQSGAETVLAVLGGHNDATVAGAVDLIPHVKAGKLKILLILQDKRWPALPNVPHMLEKGYDFYAWSYIYLYGPKGLPESITKKLEDAFRKAMKDPSFVEILKKFGVEPGVMTGKEYTAFWKSKYDEMGKVIKAMGLVEE